MTERLQEIRARLDDWRSPWVMDDAATADRAYLWAEQASADIAWLLDEVEGLRNTKVSASNPLCDGSDDD